MRVTLRSTRKGTKRSSYLQGPSEVFKHAINFIPIFNSREAKFNILESRPFQYREECARRECVLSSFLKSSVDCVSRQISPISCSLFASLYSDITVCVTEVCIFKKDATHIYVVVCAAIFRSCVLVVVFQV